MLKVLIKNPWLRTIIPLILMGVVSVSASTLVVEISQANAIQWSLIPQKLSFYVLFISTLFLGIYQVQIFKYDKNLMKGFTAKQYEAAIRNNVAEDVAARSKQLIRDGDIDQLERETEVFKKLYGEAKQ